MSNYSNSLSTNPSTSDSYILYINHRFAALFSLLHVSSSRFNSVSTEASRSFRSVSIYPLIRFTISRSISNRAYSVSYRAFFSLTTIFYKRPISSVTFFKMLASISSRSNASVFKLSCNFGISFYLSLIPYLQTQSNILNTIISIFRFSQHLSS